MTVRAIVTYPDSRLHQNAEAITTFDAALRTLADDLLDTMQSAGGVGITGPHVGILRRIVVLALPDVSSVQVYINPVITWLSPETVQQDEGSISMAGVVGKMARAAHVTVEYQNLDGEPQTENAEGFRAVCHQHEIDQLNGIFWIDKLSSLKRERLVTRFAKLKKA